jgi:hypothetical protein
MREKGKTNKIVPNEEVINIEEQNRDTDSNNYGHIWIGEPGLNLNHEFNPNQSQVRLTF